MSLPRPKWFTVEQLAEELSCSVERINLYIKAGQLKMSARLVAEVSGVPAECWQDAWRNNSYCPPPGITVEEFELIYKSGIYNFDGFYIKLEEVERFEKSGLPEGGVQEERQPENQAKQKTTGNGGGRPQSPFTEAIRYAFKKFYEEKNMVSLERDNPRIFINQIKKVMEEENRNGNVAKYLSDRIKEIKTKGGQLKITTAEYFSEREKKHGELIPARDYTIGEVSKALTKLRNEYNI